jgi:AmmeMemoRadiSam system protein A
MVAEKLSVEERGTLLKLARQALECSVKGDRLPPLQLEIYTINLQENGASFVTLTKDGKLRGCIGALEPYRPLVEDVREHAAAAATQDYRFPPVSLDELADILIEISRLTTPLPLVYQDGDDLLAKMNPGIDGVVLMDGFHRATFLPQVWDKLPNPEDFLDHLCSKMRSQPGIWRTKKLEVLTYRVEEFHEG